MRMRISFIYFVHSLASHVSSECSVFRACVVADWVCIAPPARCFAVGLTTPVCTSSTRTSTRRWWWWLPTTAQSGQWAGLTWPDPNWPDLTPFDLTRPGQTRTDMTLSTDMNWSDLAHCDGSPWGNGASQLRSTKCQTSLPHKEVLNTSGHITFLRNSVLWPCTQLRSSFLCWTTASLVLYLTTDCVHTWLSPGVIRAMWDDSCNRLTFSQIVKRRLA